MVVELRILKGLSSEAVRKRTLRTRYETNRDLKAYALYIWLKNMTRAGIIHNYEKQSNEICSGLKITRATFYKYLNYAEQICLIKRKNGRLELASWSSVMEQLYITEKVFTTVYYDTTNEKQRLPLILEALEFEENKEKQEASIRIKIAKNPQVKTAFDLYCHLTGTKAEFSVNNLAWARSQIFISGTAASIYPALMDKVNPKIYRNSSTIAAAHGYKSPRLTTYLKRKLSSAGIATILKSSKSACSYKKDRVEGKERGKNANATTYYNRNEKQKIWFEPDTVIINQFLFNAPPPTAL